jgi:cysteinyl-tRNA synthetase
MAVSLRLTNTLTRRTEPFTPLTPGKASIYCCGVTVYDLCHLGHARSYINWDVLRRYLIWRGLEVTFVQNFTDIDDKILKRAGEENSSMTEVSERNIASFHQDMDALGILRPDRMPRATQCLDGIRALIGELEAKGAAYSAEGDVYFAVMKHAGYGKLSGRDLSEQQDNAAGRVADAEEARKQHPFDFALWKGAKPGEPSFPSPWGEGRPGWHIECSAMVRAELGDTIDIHLGGADLVFPHHENEIAQSEAATGQDLARVWMHNGMVNVGGQKMSKSLGNFTTIRALLESGVSAMTLRLFVLQAHYRKPLDFTAEALEAAATGWKGLNAALSLGDRHGDNLGWSTAAPLTEGAMTADGGPVDTALVELEQRFISAMDDDLNSSGGLAVLFDLAKPLRALANRLERGEDAALPEPELKGLKGRWQLLRHLAAVLGLRAEAEAATSLDDGAIDAAIAARKAAKAAKDFAEADRIRDELAVQGVELIDKPGGLTEWIRA